MVVVNEYNTEAFDFYKATIIALLNKQYNEENIKETGYYNKDIAVYFAAFFYCRLIYNYTEQQGYTTEEWKEEFEYDSIHECLACKDINFNDILNIFNIDY